MKTLSAYFVVISMLNLSLSVIGEQPQANNDASEILQKFTESRKIMSSFVIKAQEKVTFTYPEFKGTGIIFKSLEYRFDGARCKNIESVWGDINIKDRNIKEESATYFSTLWDGEKAYTYNDGLRDDNTNLVIVSQKGDPGDQIKVCSEAYKNTLVGELMGYHWGNDVQIEELFSASGTKLQLREKKSNLRGVDCYVIEADVPRRGRYTVWIDPIHDFHIARMQVVRETGDRIFNQTVREHAVSRELFEVLEFEKIGDVWFPKSCKSKRINHSEDYQSQEESEISISTVNLSPNHDVLKSFLTDDIPNGTKVLLRAFPPNIQFFWQNGEIVPDVDEIAIDQIDKMTEEILPEGKNRKSSLEKVVADAGVTLDTILAEYRKTQKRLGSLNCEGVTSENGKQITDDLYIGNETSFGVQIQADNKVIDAFTWDGKKTIHYSNETVLASSGDEKACQLLATTYAGSPLLGYLNGQSERVDVLLLKVSEKAIVSQEKLGDETCYLVTAPIGSENWRVWFSPEQGYHIVKAEVQKNSRTIYLLDRVTFNTIDNILVPVSFTLKNSSRHYNYERTKFDLKSDFAVIKAIELGISDGINVTVEGMTGSYYWKNGNVVDGEGRNVF